MGFKNVYHDLANAAQGAFTARAIIKNKNGSKLARSALSNSCIMKYSTKILINKAD